MTDQEKEIESALVTAGIKYRKESDGDTLGLDFYLPDFDVYIEAKAFHSDRTADQIARADNVIVVQGIAASRFLAEMLSEGAQGMNETVLQEADRIHDERGRRAREELTAQAQRLGLYSAPSDDPPVRYVHECQECGKEFSNICQESPLCCVCEVKDIRASSWPNVG